MLIHEPTLLQIVPAEQCELLLAQNRIGRIGIMRDDQIAIVPVNYAYDGKNVVVRTGETSLHEVALADGDIAFEIDGFDPVYQTGWSVLVRGKASVITNPEELAAARLLPVRPWMRGATTHWVRIAPAVITGRRIVEPNVFLG